MGSRRRRVSWTEQALVSLDESLAYVAADSPAAAEQLLLRLLDSAASLSELTERGRIVPEIAEPQLRELIVAPYRLVYEYDEAHVRIIALLHTVQEFRLQRVDPNS
jgi:toxin ParE1/3/4